MKMKRFLLVAVLLVASLLLASCMNVTQEYWFNADGSGKFNMDIGMSESLAGMAGQSGETGIPTEEDFKQQFLGDNPEYVTNAQASTYKKDGYVHYVVTADVTDMQKFFSTQSSSEGFVSNLEKLENGNYSFKQSVNMNSAMGSSGLDTTGTDMSAMMGSAFQDQFYTVKVHVPGVVNTNATNKSAGYAEWKVPMSELFSSKAYELTLEYSTKASGANIILYVLIALAVIAVAAVVIFFVMKKRSTPPTTPMMPPIEPTPLQ